MTALLAAESAFALRPTLIMLQAVIIIVGNTVFFGGGLAGRVQAEVPAQAISAHGPAEGQVEFGEVDGRCQGETYQVYRTISILQDNLIMNECIMIMLI